MNNDNRTFEDFSSDSNPFETESTSRPKQNGIPVAESASPQSSGRDNPKRGPIPEHSGFGLHPSFPFHYGPYPQPPTRNRLGTFLAKLFFSLIGMVMAAGLLFFICMACILGLFNALGQMEEMEFSVSEKTLSGSQQSPYKVAILPIEGIIEGKEDGFIRKAIRQAFKDERLVAVVLRINSPGGTMSGSDYYHFLIKDLKDKKKIPVIVSMGNMAASGGYYIATVGDRIFAERSTLTGSIGVKIPLYNAADLCQRIGFASSTVTSGSMKSMGDFTKPMSTEEKAIWQHLVDAAYEQFLDVIKAGRPAFSPGKSDTDQTDKEVAAKKAEKSDTKSDSALRKIADGRIYTAQDAKRLGLIDEIGFLDNAVRDAIKKAGIDESDTQVVRYQIPSGLVALLSEAESTARAANVAKLTADIAEPGVWCICPGVLPLTDEK